MCQNIPHFWQRAAINAGAIRGCSLVDRKRESELSALALEKRPKKAKNKARKWPKATEVPPQSLNWGAFYVASREKTAFGVDFT